MAAGQYTIRIHAIIDDAQVRAQIAAIQKQANAGMLGGKGKSRAGAMFAESGKKAAGASKKVAAYTTGMAKAEKSSKKFGSTTLDVTKKVVQFGAITSAIRGVTMGMGSMVQQTFELDSALTEFKKVSDLSGKGLEDYTDKAYKVGRSVARTGVEMINAATEFRKSGYNDSDALKLAKVASMYQNVADQELTAGEAANFITSQMKAYNIEAKDAEHIIDGVNEVSNNFAVSSADIATNIGKASAALAQGNVTYEQSIGLMTAMTEITRNGSTAARGLVSIQSRFNQITDETSSTGKKLTAWYEKHNIAIRDQNGQLRSFYEVGQDVSKIWNDLSKDEQMYYLNTQAGANQSRNLAALMRNYGTAVEATATAEQSAGSAAKENSKYMQSMEGSLKNLKSAWSEFANAMVDGGTIKSMMDGLSKVLRFLSSDFGQGVLKTTLALTGISLGLKGVGSIAGGLISPFSKLGGIFGRVGKGASKIEKPLGKVGKGMKVVKAPTIGAANATKKFGTAASSAAGAINPLTAGLAIMAGIGVAAGVGIYKAYKSTHKYREEVKDLQKENKESIDSIDRSADRANFLAETIDRLSKIEHKSAGQKELLKQAIDELNELYPDLNLKYDEEKDKVNKSTDAIRDYIKAQQEKAKAEAYESNFKKSIKEQLKLQEKRTKAQKKFNEVSERFNQQKQTGYVDPNLAKEYHDAEVALKDVNVAYQEASKEATKQNNNMLKSSGVWKDLAKEAKKAGVDIPEGIKSGIDEGIYTIPESLDQLKDLISFDEMTKEMAPDIASALQQGLRDGSLDLDQALDIGGQLEKMTPKLNSTGKKMVDDLFGQFANGEIDVDGLEKGLKSITKDVNNLKKEKAEVKVDADTKGADKKIKKTKKDVKGVGKTKGKAKVDVDTKKADKKVKKTKKDVKGVSKTKGKAKVDADTKGADKKIKKTKKDVKGVSKTKGKAKLDADPSGAKKGTQEATEVVETLNGKEAIAYLKEHGAEAVKTSVDEAGNAVLEMPDGKTVVISQTGADAGAKDAGKLSSAIKKVKGKSVSVSASSSGAGGLATLKSYISNIHSKTVIVTVKTNKVGGNAKGTRNADEGLSEVNEEGWEFIRDHKTGMLRVAGGGKRTVTYLNKGDQVYTHAESKRMLSDGADYHISQHKSGSKKRKKYQKKYNKKYNAKKNSYDKRVETLEYQANIKQWSDLYLAEQIQKAYKSAIAGLKKLNNSKQIKKWKKKYKIKTKSSLGTDAYRDMNTRLVEARRDAADEARDKKEEQQEARANAIEKSIEAMSDKIGSFGLGAKDSSISAKEVANKESEINKKKKELATLRKQGKITKEQYDDLAKQYNDYMKDVYKAYVDNAMKQYQTGKKTYASMRADLLAYAEAGKITWEEYYEYLDEVAQQQLEKETKILEKRQKKNEDTYSLAKSWIDRKISLLEKEKEKQAEENQELEEQNKLIELQSNLEKARSQRVRVYRQGQGWTYERDTQAIKEATDALREYNKEKEQSEAEEDSEELKQWKKIAELFEDMEAQAEIKNLEVLAGGSFEKLFGKYGTNESAWSTWLKGNLSEKYGLENLLEHIGELENREDIEKLLNANGNIPTSTIDSYISKNRFASGTLSAPAGLARVAENGYEIALLSQGDAVMPHGVSKNLMQWGAYNPTEFAGIIGENKTSQVYHFDNLVLPNVTNADSFIRELQNLPNKALQYSRSRG